MSELFRERPCVVCDTPHRSPWPTCGKKACVDEHRRRQVTGNWRNRRERWAADGDCHGCGETVESRRKKHGFVTCTACAVLAAARSAKLRERKIKAKAKTAATKRVLDRQARNVATQHARLDRGLPLSQSRNVRIPKDAELTEG